MSGACTRIVVLYPNNAGTLVPFSKKMPAPAHMSGKMRTYFRREPACGRAEVQLFFEICKCFGKKMLPICAQNAINMCDIIPRCAHVSIFTQKIPS